MSDPIEWDELPITIRQLRLLKHTLGVDRNDQNDGRCPGKFYRNYFNAGSDSHSDYRQLLLLESIGLMARSDRGPEMGGLGFQVTELGIRVVREVVGSLFKCECEVDLVPRNPSACFDCATREGLDDGERYVNY